MFEQGESTVEWEALVADNGFQLAIVQNNEAVAHSNFGTVDNPHVIFSIDTPFRFVGCSGVPSEDDMDGHEIAYFLLREGPLQRCCICGQVFKLVRLRDENSVVNDYYTLGFLRMSWDDMGDSDHAMQQNPLRAMLAFTYEHSHFEGHSNWAYTLKNPDDHDRLLVDPAYRMEQFRLAEHKATVAGEAGEAARVEHERLHGRAKVAMNKAVFENLINAEAALLELDKHFKRLMKFHTRELLDARNHARRQRRMEARAEDRTQRAHTLYLGDFSEQELQYRDYFETDVESDRALERDPAGSLARAGAEAGLRAADVVFVEDYSRQVESDASSAVARKAFRFKYRAALHQQGEHLRREERMLRRAVDRRFPELEALGRVYELKGAGAAPDVAQQAQRLYYEALLRAAVEDYRNYFESELEEDFAAFEALPSAEKAEFVAAYRNPVLEKLLARHPHTHVSLPRRADELAEGLLRSNVAGFFDAMEREVGGRLPQLEGLAVDPAALERLEGAAEARRLEGAEPKRE